ncbi:MAG: ABC transporter ATP-binding protein [Nitriliruptor sp.]|nr:MAG: ABC transporter ATP-binding protein [Nitriliruptor sp.]
MTIAELAPAATAPSTAPALRLHALRKTYPGPPVIDAIAGIDLHVAAGEMFGLLGPNGAGKSTTVGVCTTRIRPTEGHAEVFGIDVVREPARAKRRLGVVTQDNTLDRSLTLLENLRYHCRYFGWSGRRAAARAEELLERFRLTDRADAFPNQISGGMAQRLQVARAIAHRPQLLFLDEPTAGLDPQSRLALWELVSELREDGLTVVLTTHYMEEADQLCDRVAIVDHGRVLVCDTPEALKEAHGVGAVVDLVLESRPAPEVRQALEAVPGVRSVEDSEGGVRVLAEVGDGLLPRVVQAAGPAGVRDVSLQGSTLEAVFINLTGRDLRE